MSNHETSGPYLMVISAGVRKNASDVFNILDVDTGGANTFSVALQKIGDPTVLGWAASTDLENRTHDALTKMTTQQFKLYVDAMQLEKGRLAVGSVTAFKGNVRISDPGADIPSTLLNWGWELVPVAP